ncbi:efflux RND transporter permease subunit, partial [bacterium]|nr:efflux RND transporter permease subunit [bacterium]
AWKKYMGWAERGLEQFREKFHRPLLAKAIHYKSITIAIFTALFILSIGMISNKLVGLTFFPVVDGDNFTITLTMPSGTDETVTQQALDKISKGIWDVNEDMRATQPENKSIIKILFQSFKGSGNNATIDVTLLDAETRTAGTAEVIKRVREKVGDIPGAETFQFEGFNPFGKAIMISLVGDNNDDLQAAKEELKLALKAMPEISDVSDNSPIGNREIEMELKEKANHLGITVQDVISQVRQGFFGSEVQRLQRGIDEVRVWVKYSDENRKSIGQLETMKIRLANGNAYPLSELVNFKMVNGVANIRHQQFDREVQIAANQTDPKASLPDILSKIETEILEPIYIKYPDMQGNYDGQKRETDKIKNSAKIVMPIVLMLMFAIVVLTLRSVSQSLLVYSMIPLSFIGVVFGHWIHGMSLSLMSIMGMIALVGVMINDGLVLINALNINLKAGMNYMDALLDAGVSRFRPILLTTLTTVAGMAPMVLETSLQAQFLIPVSLSLAYGMMVATTTTLFLLPAMLLIVNNMKVKWKSIRTGEIVTNEEVESAIIEMKYNYEDL